jgi:glutamate N-acetyltransferase/amino-acid N-acetyltransferase
MASNRVTGFRAAGVACGVKPSGALDLALVVSERPATAAGVFTTSQFPGAPVIVSRRNLRSRRARVVVVNSGISNVAMGKRGLRDAERMATAAAAVAGAHPRHVQVGSTGVIGRPLPIAKIERGIRAAGAELSPTGFTRAARAILTTDKRPKLARATNRQVSLLGFAKGSGMIEPNMATMLAYVFTDAAVEPGFLKEALREAVEPTLNRLTIDGEMSTSDTVLVLANGAAGTTPIGARSRGASEFRRMLSDVCRDLATQLAADGEGVSRLCDVHVRGAKSDAQALQIARKVANSLLVKTALFGADPNWGRVVQALGAAGVRFDPERVSISVGGVEFLRRGVSVGGAGALRRAERAMKKKRVAIEISLGAGRGRADVLTTDLTYGYVRINAEYTT